MEQHLRADHPVLATRRPRLGKRLSPYLLALPGGAWLLVLFVVPMGAMVSLSLQSGNLFSGYNLTWHFAEYLQAFHGIYRVEFLRSLWYGTAVTAVTLAIGYPIAYWIAFFGGRHKTMYLFLLLLPFFVSFVIRTLAWEFLLSDNGIVLGTLKSWHLLPASFSVLGTSTAVISGIAYNTFPFTVLPIYVSIEKIDRSVVEAARDLYSSGRDVFLRVILPLSTPGIFAAFLLTFVPSVGDYVNQTILGGPGTYMIGNQIEYQFLNGGNLPLAASLSFVLMIGLLIGILAYAGLLGTRQIEEYL